MQIREIKERLSLQRVLSHYNLHPDGNSRLKCPFHKDNTPSFQVYPETNTWTCFSSNCSAGSGDQIDFIMKHENISKHQAIMKAKTLVNGNPQIEKSKPILKAEKPDSSIIEKIYGYFENGLNSVITKKPKEYLEQRGLDHTKLNLGYNSGQFHHRGKLTQEDTKACIAAGLLMEYKGYTPNGNKTTYTAFAKDCIVFPLRNKENQTISLYGRSLSDKKGTKHYYLKSRSGLYPGYPGTGTRRLILTEAIIDAATLFQLSELTKTHSILSLYGTNGLTPEHIEAIKEWGSVVERSRDREIILFFDGDKAGQQAIHKHYESLHQLLPQINISYVETPIGEDVNSLYVNYDKDAILQLIEERIFLHGEAVKEDNQVQKDDERSLDTCYSILNTANPEYITYTYKNLLFTLLGGINLNQLDRLRITLKVSCEKLSIRHSIDLYNDDACEKFIAKAAERLETETKLLRIAMSELTDQLEQYRLNHIENQKLKAPEKKGLSPERKQRAVDYLRAADLLKRTNEDIGKTGMVGEENNRLLMLLVFTSRLRENPLHIISLGASGTGKTYLQEKISELIPRDQKLEITMLSENAFYYFEKTELKNKLVLIEDMDGAESVLYPLRELQSKKRISKTIPIKDNKGNLKTITMQVEGPICLAGTTTKERLYEDNANRSLLIYLDNSREHKEKIMSYQRMESAGKINKNQERELKQLLIDVQSVLKPVKVRNPYAEDLKIPDYIFKPLRTNTHYLAFIETITFYHQYQRRLVTGNNGEKYIETTLEDIEAANILLKDVLLAKSDELPKAVREFFEGLKYHVKSTGKESFFAKEVREKLRLHPMTVNRYVRDLEHRGYLKKSGGNRKTGFEYEVCNWQEYDQLQEGMQVLSEILDQLKQKESKYNRSITNGDVILKPSESTVN